MTLAETPSPAPRYLLQTHLLQPDWHSIFQFLTLDKALINFQSNLNTILQIFNERELYFYKKANTGCFFCAIKKCILYWPLCKSEVLFVSANISFRRLRYSMVRFNIFNCSIFVKNGSSLSKVKCLIVLIYLCQIYRRS